MNGFVPVTVGDKRFNAAHIADVDVEVMGGIDIWYANGTNLTLYGVEAEAFLAWWDLRADILHASEDSDE